MYSVLNCHNIAKHIEFYLGWLRTWPTSGGHSVDMVRSRTKGTELLLVIITITRFTHDFPQRCNVWRTRVERAILYLLDCPLRYVTSE
jgi:hypothetical protein